MNKNVSQEEVCNFLDYRDGALFWKRRELSLFKNNRMGKIWNSRYSGKEAGTQMRRGYIIVSINNTRYLAHRLVWLMFNGEFPEKDVDHINGITNDNRIENLREASKTQNLANQPRTRGEVGFKGVSLDKRNGRFLSRIRFNNKNYHIGTHETAEEAHAAYCVKAKELFGEYANFGS